METVIVIGVCVFVVALIISNLNEDARRRSEHMRAYFARQNAIRAAEEAAAEAAEAARTTARRAQQRNRNIESVLVLVEKNHTVLSQYPLAMRRSVIENPGKYGYTYDADGVLHPLGATE